MIINLKILNAIFGKKAKEVDIVKQKTSNSENKTNEITDLEIIEDIFSKELKSQKFSSSQLNHFILNRRDYYLGLKVNSFRSREIIDITDTEGKSIINQQKQENKTLFKHNDIDYYYYDVLDHDRRYEKVNEGLLFCLYACSELESLDDVIKKYKKERRI